MSKFVAAVRKLFSRNKDDQKGNGENNQPNEFQKAVKKPRQYDEVDLPEDGSAPKVQAESPDDHNNCQVAKRAPRQYEEVDLPAGGGVAIS